MNPSQPLNYPSLSELLSVYQNNGIPNGINQAAGNFTSAAKVSVDKAKNQADVANRQTELGIQQQNADTTAAGEKARFIPSEMAERVTGTAPGTFGAPGTLIPTTAIDAYNQRKGHEADTNAVIAGQANLKQIQVQQQQLDAQLKAQAEADRTREQAQANRTTTGTTMLENANTHQPGFWASALDGGYHLLTNKHIASVQNNMDQREMGKSMLGAQPTQAPVYSHTATDKSGNKIGFNAATGQWEPIR